MPESVSPNIDSQQQRIDSIKNPEKLQQRISQHRNVLFDAVDSAQINLIDASKQLQSPEAQSFLRNAAEEVKDYLRQIADNGFAIMHKHKISEGLEVAESDLAPVSALSASLSANLNKLKAGIDDFRKLEDATKTVERMESEDVALDAGSGDGDIQDLINKKGALIKQLVAVESGLPNNPLAKTLRDAIAEKCKVINAKADTDTKGLGRALTFNNRLEASKEQLSLLDKAVAAYEKDASDSSLDQARSLVAGIGIEALRAELDKNDQAGIVKNVFDYLWQSSFRPLDDSLKLLEGRIDEKEKEVLSGQAKLVLETVKQSWDNDLKAQWERYERMDYLEKNEEGKELEDSLLRKLLANRAILAKFADDGMGDKIGFETHSQISERMKVMTDSISRIEGFRMAMANDLEMNKSQIGKYVRFGAREGEGVINDAHYDFTPEFFKLSGGEQLRVRMIAEEINEKNLKTVRDDTKKIAMESANPQERMKILGEILGEKGKSYFSALDKLQKDDPDGAVKELNAYVAQSFSAEEMTLHADTIADAREIVKGLLAAKLKILDNLFADVKELAYARSKMVGNPELKVDEGHEADVISAQLEAFKQDIADGKITDFDSRYTTFKQRVSEALENKQKKETDLMKMLDRLHDVSREKDPQKRKEGFGEFANLARESQAYKLAMKYLDYALEDELAEASKHLSRADVLKMIMADSQFVNDLNVKAQEQLSFMLKDNPGLKGQLTLESVKNNLLERALNDRYKRELRRSLGTGNNDKVLNNYDNWFPIDDPKWYKPWDYGAEQWDEFQVDCVKFVVESLPTLGIGLWAGAAGRAGAKIGGKMLLRYLGSQGLTRAEILAIEQGGLAALRASMQSGKQLSYGAGRLVGALSMESATMFTMGLGMEYLQSGQVQAFKDSPGRGVATGISQSMLQASLFRVIGMGLYSGPLHAEMQKGLIRGGSAWMAAETVSGAAGAGVEYAFAKMQGHEFTGQDAFKSFMSNYLMAAGMHAAQGPPRASRADKAMNDSSRLQNRSSTSKPQNNDLPLPAKNTVKSAEGEVQVKPKSSTQSNDANLRNDVTKSDSLNTHSFEINQIQKVLAQKDYKPNELLDAMKSDPKLKRLLEADAGVSEGYSIQQHTEMVMNQFEKYFANNSMPAGVDKNFFRLLFAVHDIGKPIAIEKGGTHLQHQETVPLVRDLFSQLGMSNKQIDLACAVLSADPIGKFLRGRMSTEDTLNMIDTMAVSANQYSENFFNIVKIFYLSDASAYTTDAGGAPSLDILFRFDRASGSMKMREPYHSKLNEIETNLRNRDIAELEATSLLKELRTYAPNSIVKYANVDFRSLNNQPAIDQLKAHVHANKQLVELQRLSPDLANLHNLDSMTTSQLNEASIVIGNQHRLLETIVRLARFDKSLANDLRGTDFMNADAVRASQKTANESIEMSYYFVLMRADRLLSNPDKNVSDELRSILGQKDDNLRRYLIMQDKNSPEAVLLQKKLLHEAAQMDGTTQISSLQKLELYQKLVERRGHFAEESKMDIYEGALDILRDGRFSTSMNHGTDSRAWDGLIAAGGEMLSAAELIRRGFQRSSGEGEISGATLNDSIYMGGGLDGLGTAHAYARANESIDGYRDFQLMDSAKLTARINKYQDILQQMDALNLNDASDLPRIRATLGPDRNYAGLSKEALLSELRLMVGAQKPDNRPPLVDPPYQMIIGISPHGLPSYAVPRPYGSALSGERVVTSPVIALANHLEVLFVPAANVQDARQNLERAIGSNAARNVRITPAESLNLLGTLHDGLYNQTQEATYNALHTTQEGRQVVLSWAPPLSPQAQPP